MIKAIKAQTYLMINKKNFWISFYIMLAYSIITYFYFLFYYWGWEINSIPTIGYFYLFLEYSPFINNLMLLFPFIVPLAFSFSYFEDMKYGTHNFFIVRNSRKTYYTAKALVCFIGNFLIIVLPGLIYFLLLKITFFENNNTLFGQYKTQLYFNNLFVDDTIPIKAYYPFISFYIKNINLYHLIHLILVGIVTGILGVFSYVISFRIKNNKILIFLPVYLIFYFSNILPLPKIMEYIILTRKGNRTYLGFIIMIIIILLYSIYAVIRQIRKEDLD